MSTWKVSPRKATVLTAAILAASTLGSPALAAVQSISSISVTAAAADTVVSRLSVSSGPVAGTNKLVISGSGLATGTSGSYTKKTVKFGTVTVVASKVTVLSTSALEVEVPAASPAKSSTVTVVVGDATKGPKYSYAADDVTVTTNQAALTALTPKSDTGLADVEIEGTNFEAATTVVLGGKTIKPEVTATKLTVDLPAGLAGPQDVVVKDPRNSVYVGYVTYEAKTPTVTAASTYALVEAPTKITLTGTNLDAVTAVTYGTSPVEKASFAKTTDATKLVVTLPKGSARTADVKVATKYGKTATFSVERKASGTPTVTAASGAVAAGGDVTLTGTNLVGLKTVTVTNSDNKTFKGSVVSVASGTSATVKLPKLAAGTYGIVVKTNAATASTSFSFTVATGAPTVTAAAHDTAKTVITLTGTYLKTATKVVFTPTSGSAVTATSGLVSNAGGTSLAVTLGSALADGTYSVVVTNPAGASTSATLTVS